MKRVLTFEAIPELPGGGLLLQLAVALRQLNINPEGLVWMVLPPDGALKVRLVLSSEDRRWLPAVADHLREVPGVREVRCLSDTDPLPPADNAQPSEGQSCMD
jgi:hypothetical protein